MKLYIKSSTTKKTYGSAGDAIFADVKNITKEAAKQITKSLVYDHERIEFDDFGVPRGINFDGTLFTSSGSEVNVYGGTVSVYEYGVEEDSWYEIQEREIYGKCVQSGDTFIPLSEYSFTDTEADVIHMENAVSRLVDVG